MFDGVKKWLGLPTEAQVVEHTTIARMDGWINTYTGANVPGVDKTVHGYFDYQPLDQWMLENLYYGNDVARKIIDQIVFDTFREGYTVTLDGDADKGQPLIDRAAELKVDHKVAQSFKWARLYGGAGLLLGVQDMKPLQEPVKPDVKSDFTYVRPVDKRYANAVFWDTDVESPDYGDPRTWLVGSYSGQFAFVHTSRFICIRGISTDEVTKRRLQGWGFPTLQPVFDVLQGLGQAEHAAINTLVDMNVDVFSLKGLTQAVAAKRGAVIQERLHAVDMRKGVHKSVLIDAENEKYERHAGNIPSGVDAILNHVLYRISCAADMPVSILFGRAPQGMNATGDMDVRLWYDRVKAFQKDDVKPVLMAIYRRIGASLGIDCSKLDIVFATMYQLTSTEQAALEKTTAEKDAIYLDQGVLTPEEVAKSRYGSGRVFRTETEIDPDLPREKPTTPVDPAATGGEPDGDEPDDGTDPPKEPKPGDKPAVEEKP